MHRLSPSGEFGSFFFQPLDFHLQPAYLLIQLLVVRRVLGRTLAAAVFKQPGGPLQDLLLPSCNLASRRNLT